MNSCPVSWVIGAIHIDSGLDAAHHMASLEIMSPWENISGPLQTALGSSGVTVFGYQKGVVGGEAASDILCCCRNLQDLA
jgi:hypothetical protein